MSRIEGILAEFDQGDEILAAAKRVAGEGYRRVEAFTPYSVEGLAEAIGFEEKAVAPIVLGGGVLGALTAYGMQYYCVGMNYPFDIGGRPLNSIPSFIPITFELTVLFASFAALFAVFFLNGMPRLWRPVWNLERFRRVTKDGFFLFIESGDPKFDREKTRVFLEATGARGVYELEA